MKLIKLGFTLITLFAANAMSQEVNISCLGEHVILSADKTSGFYILGRDSNGTAFKLTLKKKDDWFYEYAVSPTIPESGIVSSRYENFKISRSDLSISYNTVVSAGAVSNRYDNYGKNCKQSDADLRALLKSIQAKDAQDAEKIKMQPKKQKEKFKIYSTLASTLNKLVCKNDENFFVRLLAGIS
jgi:hypothetical protein